MIFCLLIVFTRQLEILVTTLLGFLYRHCCLSTIYHEKICSSLVFVTATTTFMDFKNRRLLSDQPCARTFGEKSSVLMRVISHPRPISYPLLKWVKKKTNNYSILIRHI